MKTAIHEAGHVVAHVRLGIPWDLATIKPDDEREGGVLGAGGEQALCAWDAADHVLAHCGGFAALIAAGRVDALIGAEEDMQHAGEIIATWGLSALEEWKAKAVELMRRPENVRAVDHVAKALLQYETLPSDYLEVLIEYADGECTDEEWQQFVARFPDLKEQA